MSAAAVEVRNLLCKQVHHSLLECTRQNRIIASSSAGCCGHFVPAESPSTGGCNTTACPLGQVPGARHSINGLPDWLHAAR